MFKNCLLVMLGGGIGSALRYITTVILNQKFKLDHWSTFWVNITGCFMLGLLFNKVYANNPDLFTFIIIGLIGSYTTFSAFEYENINLIAHEKYLEFIKYSTFSCGFAFIALICGFYIAKFL